MTEILKGKVKTVFSTDDPNMVLIQYEDKVTAGNGKKVDYPKGKGEVCCKISEFLFQLLEKYGIRTHYLSMPTHNVVVTMDPSKVMCCKKVDIIPIEVVVRNVAAGSIVRQTTLEEGRIINWPLVEYYLKDDEKDDPLLTEDRIRLMGDYPLSDLEQQAREVNAILMKTFREIGFTLVDFKLEFGYTSNGDLVVSDELSPDSMRLWKEGTKERFDKDLFRKDEGDIVEAYKHILHLLNYG